MVVNRDSLNDKCDSRIIQIGIIGLGLIGGSIAKSLSVKNNLYKILVFDENENSVRKAIDDKVASIALNNDITSLKNCDIIFLCTPVRISIEYLNALAPVLCNNTIITDVCSTKSEIVKAAEKLNGNFTFIAGHPMAGSEKSGYDASTAHLFENAYYVLSPLAGTCPSKIAALIEVIDNLGAIPLIMPPSEHDYVTGCISHLPHILASTLVNLTKKSDTPEQRMRTLAAGGFKDITRIASSNPLMWQQICLSNSREITSLIRAFQRDLDFFISLIELENDAELLTFFQSAKQYRDTIPSYDNGLIPRIFEINVDIEDKPGIIGDITTMLGRNNINIKNLHIKNNRDVEPGCLRISFNSSEDMKAALELLKSRGYSCFF